MADECPSGANYDGSGSVTRGLGRVRNVQGSTPTYTWGPAMMLRVVYMAHMCLPVSKGFWVGLGLRLRFRVAVGMEVLLRVLDRARNVQGSTLCLYYIPWLTRGVNG